MPDLGEHATLITIAAGSFVLLLFAGLLLRRFVCARNSLPGDADQPLPEPLPLTTDGPSGSGPQLYLRGICMRPAIVVIAPVGRGSPLPQVEEVLTLLDQVTPGLASVLTSQPARIKLWPPQLSVQGFAQAFFTHYRLPGDRGRGTAWCQVAGKFDAGNRPLLLGLALAAAAPNSLSQIVVQQEGEWSRLLEVRKPQ